MLDKHVIQKVIPQSWRPILGQQRQARHDCEMLNKLIKAASPTSSLYKWLLMFRNREQFLEANCHKNLHMDKGQVPERTEASCLWINHKFVSRLSIAKGHTTINKGVTVNTRLLILLKIVWHRKRMSSHDLLKKVSLFALSAYVSWTLLTEMYKSCTIS